MPFLTSNEPGARHPNRHGITAWDPRLTQGHPDEEQPCTAPDHDGAVDGTT